MNATSLAAVLVVPVYLELAGRVSFSAVYGLADKIPFGGILLLSRNAATTDLPAPLCRRT